MLQLSCDISEVICDDDDDDDDIHDEEEDDPEHGDMRLMAR